MDINNIITNEIPSLIAKDSIETAIQYMDDWKVGHLAVLDGKKFLGLLDESVLLSAEGVQNNVGEFELIDIKVSPKVHIFDVIELMVDYKLSMVAVVDEEGNYLGEILPFHIIECLADLTAVRQEGSVIVLEMNDVDYSLGDIARHVEANDAKVLSASVARMGDSRMVQVSLKINETSIRGIVQTLQRYNYTIKATYDAPNYQDDLRNRYDELMRYLNT
ncbi:CBS domain-containing protein [Sanyastnella coralliicola]|uniref:CBS domain-containing protein n=1 Tax=Sanyastnella coralliicola TaxID=3069118 RepID=UPI0027B93261|nr:CBS domain-containing protein [Longitalea sp. SCSIO 12813]